MRERIRMACLAVAVVGLLAAGAGACAGRGGEGAKVASVGGATTTTTGSNGGSANRGGNAGEQALRFAKCMREHGVDMPDPKVGANGTVEFGIRGNPDDPKFKEAQKACQETVGGPFGNGDGPADPKFQEAALRFAKCMREHGISKFPDPQPNGGLLLRSDSGIDPSSPTFKAAQKACEQLLPRPKGADAPPGSAG
jgi:hypothetical protein